MLEAQFEESESAAWNRRLIASFNRRYPAARNPIVDRIGSVEAQPLDVALTRLRARLRWRESQGSGSVVLEIHAFSGDGALRACKYAAAALRRAADAHLVVPVVWLTSDEDEDLPFLAFERVTGESFETAWRRRRPEARAEEMADILADLHDGTVTPSRTTVPLLDELVAKLQEAVSRAAFAPEGLPMADRAVRWLASTRPTHISVVLCHGDFRPGNLVFVPREGLMLTGWERASEGDPRLDVARASISIAETSGGLLRTPFLSAYRGRRSLPPSDLAWFEVAVGLERIMTYQAGDARFASASTWLERRIDAFDRQESATVKDV